MGSRLSDFQGLPYLGMGLIRRPRGSLQLHLGLG